MRIALKAEVIADMVVTEPVIAKLYPYDFEIYKEQDDEAEEVLWKAKAFSRGYFDSLLGGLPDLIASESDRKKIILGTYPDGDDIHKRPLSLMKQDVGKCAGMRI